MEYTQEAAGRSRVCGQDSFGKSNFTVTFFLNNSLVILVSHHREKHDEFGDVKKVVTDEFVRQK